MRKGRGTRRKPEKKSGGKATGCDMEAFDDLMPPQDEKGTLIHHFFEELGKGRLVTSRCRGCGSIHWHPRAVCPRCMARDLEWVPLPDRGRVYAFTTVDTGGGRSLVTVAIVELEGTGIRLFTRIEGRPGNVSIGTEVAMKVRSTRDGRVTYVFAPVKGDGK